jgi:hypothetical protein
MLKISSLVSLLLMTAALTGCKEELTYSYLMQHPSALKQALDNCESTNKQSSVEAAQCNMAVNADAALRTLINNMLQDPEKFGQNILDEEAACVKAKDSLHEAKQRLETLRAKSASSAEVQAVEDVVNKAKQSYQDEREKVAILLAVAGMGSPE